MTTINGDEAKNTIELLNRIEALTTENRQLVEENDGLRERLDKRTAVVAMPNPKKQWTRGTLPGGVLIKTNTETGKFIAIEKQEWEALG